MAPDEEQDEVDAKVVHREETELKHQAGDDEERRHEAVEEIAPKVVHQPVDRHTKAHHLHHLPDSVFLLVGQAREEHGQELVEDEREEETAHQSRNVEVIVVVLLRQFLYAQKIGHDLGRREERGEGLRDEAHGTHDVPSSRDGVIVVDPEVEHRVVHRHLVEHVRSGVARALAGCVVEDAVDIGHAVLLNDRVVVRYRRNEVQILQKYL